MQIFSVMATHPAFSALAVHQPPHKPGRDHTGPYRSSRFAAVLWLAVQGDFCVADYTGPWGRADSCPKGSFGNGPDPCQVWQLPGSCSCRPGAVRGQGVMSSQQGVSMHLAWTMRLTSSPSSRLPCHPLSRHFTRSGW